MTPEHRRAMRIVHDGRVRFLISACGPDDALACGVDHLETPYVRYADKPGWQTYKELYQHGLIRLVQDDPAYPWGYRAEPHPDHLYNREGL